MKAPYAIAEDFSLFHLFEYVQTTGVIWSDTEFKPECMYKQGRVFTWTCITDPEQEGSCHTVFSYLFLPSGFMMQKGRNTYLETDSLVFSFQYAFLTIWNIQ